MSIGRRAFTTVTIVGTGVALTAGILAPAASASATVERTTGAPVVAPKAALAAAGPGALTDPTLRALAAGGRTPSADVPALRSPSAARGATRTVAGRPAVAVELTPTGTAAAAKAAVRAVGGRVTGQVPGVLVAADVPVTQLARLGASSAITGLQVPTRSLPADDRSQTATASAASGAANVAASAVNDKIRSRAWHSQDWKGRGVRIGVVDSFSGSVWNRVAATGAVPANPKTFCRRAGAPCNLWSTGGPHGVAVVERIRSIAPKVTFYLAYAETAADLQAAVNFFDANGVDVISRSEGAYLDGDGAGHGARTAVAENAVARGMMWVNSAGNFANGGYFRSRWVDTDGDGWMNFPDGGEFLRFDCSAFVPGVRWDDWGAAAARTDYDLYVYDEPGGTLLNGDYRNGFRYQQRGDAPIEYVDCGSSYDRTEYLAIRVAATGSATYDDTIELFTFAGNQFWSNPHSATQAVTDSASPGVLAAGAIAPGTGGTAASYSAWGPTNDGRLKPDLSAPVGWYSRAYEGAFGGTSEAAPVVAAASALLLEAFPDSSPADTANWLRSYGVRDRGAAGPDRVYGRGELALPTPYTRPDVTKPKLRVTSRAAAKATVKARWRASDPERIARVEVWRSVNGGAYRKVATRSTRTAEATLRYGRNVRFAVRAQDRSGVWSLFTYSKTIKVTR